MALGYDGVIRIDTAINRDGFSKGLKDMSDEMEKEVRSSEKLLEDLQKKRDDAANAVQVKQSGLDEERLKLAALKKEWQQLKEIAGNSELPAAVREEAEAKIPAAEMQFDKQREHIAVLEREYEKIAASVEKYDGEIADASGNLEIQKIKAQEAAEALAEAENQLIQMNSSAEVGNQKMVELSHTLAQLKERQKELENAGLGLGFREYDENVSQIAAISTELKAYQKELQTVGDAGDGGEKLLESLRKISESFANGGGVDLSQLAGGWQKQLDQLKNGLRDAAEAVGDAWDKMISTVKQNAAAVRDALAAVVRGGAQLAENALAAVKGIVPLVKNLNGAAAVSQSLHARLQQLGNTLKRALVFSVVYRGVSLLRQELSAYLMVNQQFVAALAQVRGVLLTAFQPVYEAVVPALTTLLNFLSGVIAAVSHFTASLFGTTVKKAQKNAESLYQQAHAMQAVGGAAENAAKAADTAIASFDEFNILSFPDSGGSAGGASPAGFDMPDFDYEYDEAQFDSWGEAFSAFLDKLLDGIPKLEAAFQNFAGWLNDLSKKLYDMFTFPGVVQKVERLGKDLAGAFNKLVNWIDWYQLGQALGAGLNLALQFLTEFIYGFNWLNLGRKLAEFINGLVHEVDWYDFGRLLWAQFKIALESLAGFLLGLDMPQLASAASQMVTGFFDEMVNTIKKIQWADIGRQIAAFLNNIDWYGAITSALAAIAAAVMALKMLIDGFLDGLHWDDIAKKIYTAVNSAMGSVDWHGLGQTLGNAFIRAVSFLRDLIAGIDWYQIGVDVGRFLTGIDWVGALGALAQTIAAAINAAIKAVRGFLDTLSPHIQDIAHGIAEKINEFFRTVDWAGAGRAISDGLKAALDFALEFMRTVDWNAIGKCIVTLLENIDWGSLLTKWGQLVGEAMTAKLALMNLDGFIEIGTHVVEGLLKGMLDKIASIGTWLKDHIADPIVNGVKTLFGIHSPSTVMAEIGRNLTAGLLLGISESWSSIVEFFCEKLEDIKKTLSDAWENISNAASTAWQNIRTILEGIWENLKASVKTVFEDIKATISTIWENIKSKTTEIWNNIKTTLTTLWNELKNTVINTFNEIKNKIVEVWTTIKNEAAAKWNEIKSTIAEKINNIKQTVSEGFARVKETITSTVTEAIDALKSKDWTSIGRSIVNGIANGLNGIFDKLKSWASRVWDSVSNAFSGSGKSTASSRSASSYRMAAAPAEYGTYQIPKLANGTVIPPNQQFLAILGDQRSGVNVEAPLSTIKQAVSDAIRDMGGIGGDIHITVESILDGRVVARNTVKHINDMTTAAGRPVLLV